MILLNEKPQGIKTISATQLKQFEACPRAWGFQHIEGHRKPPTKSQELGSRVHAILEDWLLNGTAPDENEVFLTEKGLKHPGRIAMAGLSLLPPPPQLLVEQEFWLDMGGGVVFHGLIDLLVLAGLDAEVIDHKTTSAFKWAMDEDQLRDDIQQIIYSGAAVAFGASQIRTSWVYYLTSNSRPDARKVTRQLTAREAEESIRKLIPRAQKVLEAGRECSSAMELPVNVSHCGAYGGCPYSEKCDISPKERFMAAMDISDFIKKQQQAQGQNNVPAPQPPAAPPAPVPQPPTAPPAPPAPEPPVPAAPPAPPAPEPPVPQVPSSGYDPNDMNTWGRPQLKAKAVELGLVEQSSRVGEKKLRELIDQYNEAQKADVAIDEAITTPAQALDSPEAFDRALVDSLNNPAPPPAPEPVPAPPVTEACAGKCDTCSPQPEECPTPPKAGDVLPESVLGMTLYVDCIPVGAPVAKLSAFVAEAQSQLGFDVDYRLSEEGAYGKAAALISQGVGRLVRECRPTKLVMSTRVPEHRDCLAVLEDLAELVVKGC